MTATSSILDRYNPFKKKKPEDIYSTPIASSSAALKSTQPVSSTMVSSIDNPFQREYHTSSVTPTPTQQPPQPSATSSFINQIGQVSQEQEKFLQDQAKAREAQYNQSYGRKIDYLQGQIPQVQQAFDQFRANTQAGIGDAEARAEIEKSNVENEWGANQRSLAQTRLESEGRTRNRYANLGTLDSFGAGSYNAAQDKLESSFLRSTNEGLQEKAQNKFIIDQELATFVREAQSIIFQEEIKLNDKIKEIQMTIGLTQDERDAAIRGAYEQSQAGVLEIKNYLAELKYQKALADEELSNAVALEQAKVQTEQAGQTRANTQIVNTIDQLLSSDTKPITGAVQIGSLIPGTKAQTTKNIYNQLQSMLSLQGRQQLKGSGAISDYEMKILERASSNLSRSMSDDEFRAALVQLRNQLAGVASQDINPYSFIE